MGLGPGELGRKAIHLSTFLVPLAYLLPHVSRRGASLALTLGLLVLVVIEVVRLRSKVFRALFHQVFREQLRHHEERELLGGTYLVIGFLVAILAFRRVEAVAACEFLVLGDTAAALVGKGLGRVRLFDKTLEGSLACLVVCAAVGWGLSALYPQSLPLDAAFAGALTATLFEALPLPVDDNLKIPLSAGLAMHFLIS